PAAAGAALVGPNAVLQTAQALRAHGGEALAARIFAEAGLPALLAAPPEGMVPERVAADLHRALAASLPEAEAQAVARDAGRRTADYLLAHRIPRPAQWLLRALPGRLAARLLLAAIGRHAWTFAGSGRFEGALGREGLVRIAIHANPLALPGGPWHAAVFERLFRALVSRESRVRSVASCADGHPACRFEISLR
ncbi:MAG: bacteriochlorophyll 4-vinyl reductase, partial [Pseudomonadota bacterium]